MSNKRSFDVFDTQYNLFAGTELVDHVVVVRATGVFLCANAGRPTPRRRFPINGFEEERHKLFLFASLGRGAGDWVCVSEIDKCLCSINIRSVRFCVRLGASFVSDLRLVERRVGTANASHLLHWHESSRYYIIFI